MIDTQQLKQQVDLTRILDTSLLRKASRDELCGPCPKCGGDDRFSLWPDHFFCRQCKPPAAGKFYDAIDFCEWYYGDDFMSAIGRLSGNSFPTMARASQVRTKPAKDFGHGKAAADADNYHKLLGSKPRALAYLYDRGLTDETIAAFMAGCNPLVSLPGTWDGSKHIYPKQPAITLPWYNRDGGCVGIRYRFLESHTYTDVSGRERTAKKSSLYNSTFSGGYGWHTLRNAKYLVIVEGEINAMSIWQCREDIDVISVGSETSFNSLSNSMKQFIARYEKVLVWADKRNTANKLAVPINASSYVDTQGKDANDRLVSAHLRSILDYVFPTEPERQPLPRKLWRKFAGDTAAVDARRYYETVTDLHIAYYHAADGVGMVIGEKVKRNLQDDFGLMVGQPSAAMLAALKIYNH